jgi:predicted AAA+ superfamily ATPase
MKNRTYWHEKIEQAWRKKSVVWLSGVRRSGKTVLCQTLPNVEYFDCELPRVRREMEDPEEFLKSISGKRIILDEIHRLENPSELLKIAADHFPSIKIIATGSSTLGASAKFKDTLTGRKTQLWLTPMVARDLKDFGQINLKRRLLRGGLPPFFLSENLPEADFQEWMDSYWAKDIQELFHLEKRQPFQKFAELLLASSGSIFEATTYARPCEVSRGTINNYLKTLETTHAAHVLRPYHTSRATEIVAAPKVYGFDTGFVCYHKGWHDLRAGDLCYLWEHYVLNEMHARLQAGEIHYWRDQQGHEVDFVLVKRGGAVTAIECNWSEKDVDWGGLAAFHKLYPQARHCIVAQDVSRTHDKNHSGMTVTYTSVDGLLDRVIA